MEPLRRKKTIEITKNPKNGRKRILGAMTEENVLSDQGSIDSVNVSEKYFLDCGCDAKAVGRCYECHGLCCESCFGHCDACKKPICPEHSKFVQTNNQTVTRLCRACYDEINQKRERRRLVIFCWIFLLNGRPIMNNIFSKLTENVKYCWQNGLLKDKVGRSIFRIYRAGVCDEEIAQMFESRASKHKYSEEFYGPQIFKEAELKKGDYVLGTGKKNEPLRSYIQYLNAHCLTVAGSGSGKTTASYFKILQIAGNLKGIWLFDLIKRVFRFLKKYLAGLGVDITILNGRSLRINPLQLPLGVELSHWIPRVADMLEDVLELPPRASKLLQAKLFPLYNKFNRDEFPTLYHLFEAVKVDKTSNHQARVAILDSLEPVLLSLGPKVLAYRYGWTSHDLSSKPIVFEFAGLSEVDKNLLLNTLLLSEFTSRVSRGISNPKMDLFIFVDECQRICSSSTRTSAIANLIGLIRGTGIGLDLSLQSTNNILPQIVSNTATKILGKCGSDPDYTVAGRNMGLNSEQIEWAKTNLDRGKFICQLGEGRWRYPFVLNIPDMNIKKSHDPDLYDVTLFSDIKTVYANEFDNWGMDCHVASQPSMNDKSLFESPKEFSFCKAIVENSMQPSSAYSKLAGISSKSAVKIRTHLISKKYIKENKINSGGRGRSTILLEALPEGIKAVQEYKGKSI